MLKNHRKLKLKNQKNLQKNVIKKNKNRKIKSQIKIRKILGKNWEIFSENFFVLI